MKASEAKSQLLSGSLWTFFGYGLSQVIRLGTNLLLARLLFPEAFGIMSLVNVVILGLNAISDLGIGPSIIYSRRGEEPRFLNTAWTIHVIRGFILWIILCLITWPFAVFFGHDPATRRQLMEVIPIIGLATVINGFNSTSVYLLNRSMRMAEITFLELFPQILSVVVMYLWARLINPDIWALAVGLIVCSIIRLPLTHWFNRPGRNAFELDKESLAELKSFGQWVFLGTIVSFFAGNLDRLILGKLLTMAALGVYSMSLNFARFGTEICTRLASNVLFPVLARSQDNPSILVERSLKARAVILDVAGPLVTAFVILSPAFFHRFYDHRYAEAGVIAQWLGISVWCSVILNSMEKVPLALGHPKASFYANLVSCLGYVLAIPLYYTAGLPGFIIGTSLGLVISHFYLLIWVPVHRTRMLMQTLNYSIAFLAYNLFSLYLIERFGKSGSPEVLLTLLLIALPCTWGGWKLLGHLRAVRMKSDESDPGSIPN